MLRIYPPPWLASSTHSASGAEAFLTGAAQANRLSTPSAETSPKTRGNSWAGARMGFTSVKQVSHYSASFESKLGPKTPLDLPRSVNSRWTKGDLMLAPLVREAVIIPASQVAALPAAIFLL